MSGQIISARNKHKIFLIELKAHILGIYDMPFNKVLKHTECEFGKWLLEIKDTEKTDEYATIIRVHKDVHYIAEKTYKLFEEGRENESKEEMKKFEKNSNILLTLLDKTEK